VQTFVARNAAPGQTLEFTIAGSGSIPRDSQDGQTPSSDSGAANAAPGGGLGSPIATPDPLSKFKWWILSGLALVMAAGAAFLLGKPAKMDAVTQAVSTAPASKNAALLDALKEELFALESEKLAGTLGPEEYAETKTALETVLKRALKRSS